MAAPVEHKEGRPRRRGGRLGHDHPKWDVDAQHDGTLPYIRHYSDDRGTNQLGAHCMHKDHGPSCRINRRVLGNPGKLAQGRPLGFLLAWILCANDFPGPDGKAQHMAIAKHPNCLFDVRLNYTDRLDMRAWAADHVPDLTLACITIEHERTLGEGQEPEGYV